MNQSVKVLFQDPNTGESVEESFRVPPGYDEPEVQAMVQDVMNGLTFQILQ